MPGQPKKVHYIHRGSSRTLYFVSQQPGSNRLDLCCYSEPLNVELLQDDVSLRCGDFRAAAEIDENELPKFRDVLSCHTHKKIMPAGDKEDISDLGHARQAFCEGMDNIARIYLQADGNDGLKGVSHGLGVDVGVEAPDHPARDHRPDPTQAR